ncbi:MAG: DNA repair protein RadA [Clostridia bacterium]|nr:DNA repair protein RadA [Clostridia bacterium]
MANKKKTVYVCTECGYDSPKWAGKCPVCGQWNTMAEETVYEGGGAKKAQPSAAKAAPTPITEISREEEPRLMTGISELDRVLGGGMVKGSLALISGEPGIGKSTLLLQACALIARKAPVLYVTGEESLAQISMRGERLAAQTDKLFIMAETELGSILDAITRQEPALVIIDSIQTVYDPELTSVPGSVAQVRDCTMAFMQYAKSRNISIMLVGHINKDGAIAGPKILEHMVDTVLNFEGDRHASYRMLRAVKNRFGSTNEIGMFEMTDSGLSEVPNPSAVLLAGRPENSSGSCVAAALEGTRPILAEIQGLVAKSAYGSARRTSAGVDYNRAVLLLAILEKRGGIMLGAFDAYINVVGGMNFDEPAIDLGVIVAVASSYLDRPVRRDLALFGEVGLSGELRAVSGARQRIAEVQRLGFKKCVFPQACMGSLKGVGDIELLPASNITEAIRLALE